MKLFKKSLLSIILLLGLTIGTSAQSGWNVGSYYAYAGGENITCGYTYTVQKYDGYGSFWNEGWQDCKKMKWHKEYRSGYVYYWGNNGWYTQWKEGYFWYYTWYTFSSRVW